MNKTHELRGCFWTWFGQHYKHAKACVLINRVKQQLTATNASRLFCNARIIVLFAGMCLVAFVYINLFCKHLHKLPSYIFISLLQCPLRIPTSLLSLFCKTISNCINIFADQRRSEEYFGFEVRFENHKIYKIAFYKHCKYITELRHTFKWAIQKGCS